MDITVVSANPNSSTDPATIASRTRPIATCGSTRATAQQASQPVSAKSAGLRSDTGPVTSPPVATSATTWNAIVASSTQPPRNRAVSQVSGRGDRMAWVGVVGTMEVQGASVVIRFLG